MVSEGPTKVHFLDLKVSNYAGCNILIKSGDDQPGKGFAIRTNVIAEINKKVPFLGPVTFKAYRNDTKTPLLINGKPAIILWSAATRKGAQAIQVTSQGA